jgi:ornithine decarboxylase
MTAFSPKLAPKISRYLAETQPATPCLVVDLDRVEQNYAAMRAAFPMARIFYALKANPARPVLERLVSLGACFDAASWEEVEMCLAAGATPDRISFGNTIKKAASIARAHGLGINLFVFDSEAELEKLAVHAPGARVFCRLVVGTEGAMFPLARKFGTSIDMAAELMLRARALGLDPYGLSFHVGSQQMSPEAHEAAIGQAAMLFDELDHAGVKLRMLNLGGGFPAHYQDEIPAIGAFAHGIHRALAFHFGDDLPEVLVEPGRFLVGDAGVIVAEVVLVSRRAKNDPTRWVYLDIGRFGGLAETEDEATRYLITTPHDGGEDGPVVIAGPTCDSADTLYEKAGYRLPLALRHGDRVLLHATGAYVSTYATTGFNGFRPLSEVYLSGNAVVSATKSGTSQPVL